MTASNLPPGSDSHPPDDLHDEPDDPTQDVDPHEDDHPDPERGHDPRCALDLDHDGGCTWPEPDPNDPGPQEGDDGDGMLCDGIPFESLTHRLARENREAIERTETRIEVLVGQRAEVNAEVKELRAALVALNAAGRHFAKLLDGGDS